MMGISPKSEHDHVKFGEKFDLMVYYCKRMGIIYVVVKEITLTEWLNSYDNV